MTIRSQLGYFVNMDVGTRHRVILDLLHTRGRVEVPDLARRLETSTITVRRDLDVLAGLGALRRVRGGAVPSTLRGEGLPFGVRAVDEAPLKARLAAVVAGLIGDGEAVVLDSGTTGAATAQALAGRRLTVMPLSVQGIAALAGSPSVSLLLPGGTVRHPEGSIVGPLAERALAELRFDTAVLTCCAADPDAGVTAHDLADAAVKKAQRTVLVAEGVKFHRTALAVVCGLEEVDVLVTDSSAPAEVVAGLVAAGVRVEVVPA
jgi:DeoR/GlpR family transcriptional regulator of sugar metabolism